MPSDDLRGEEIAALLNDIKQRVRARHPEASVPVNTGNSEPVRVPLADLLPLLHARDAAQAKVASIGSVNPRRGGALNSFIQSVKRLISRSLGWFVRDQITFNRQVLACVEASMEAMADLNASVSMLASGLNARAGSFENQLNERDGSFARQIDELSRSIDVRLAPLSEIRAESRQVTEQLNDIRRHWHEWRLQWEKNLTVTEMQYLRGLAELQTSFSHRATTMELNMRESVKAQHTEYKSALDRAALDIQNRLWEDLEKIRAQYERLIHFELRLLRQRAHQPEALPTVTDANTAAPRSTLDYERFAMRFRGTEEYVRANQRFYVPVFAGIGSVLDIGCGRGEFLDTMRDNSIPARGIELSTENVTYCRSRGLDAEHADLFDYLNNLPEAAEDAIFCAQVVEHIDPARLPEMVRLCASRLRRGGILAFETPNPECLAIFATHFYLDPTHMRPVPHPLLAFYMEEAGIGSTQVHHLSPARESFPEIDQLPAEFAARFFGGLDYAIVGRKL